MVVEGQRLKKKRGTALKVAFSIVLALVIGLTAVIAASLNMVNNKVEKVTQVQVDRGALGIHPRVAGELRDYRNIVFLGVDESYTDDVSDLPRSDAIIIVSIYKPTKEVRLFSIYRDTLLDIGPEHGLDKINHAHHFGGATLALRSINRNLDLNCEEFVTFNWKAVTDAIDALDGIDIEIQESEIQEMNKYIKDTQRIIGGAKELIQSPGMQRLNGIQATAYARIRKDHIEGDFRRSERTKAVVARTFAKARTVGLFELNRIADKLLPEIKTNMVPAQITEILLGVNSYRITDQSQGWPFTIQEWFPQAWYCVPDTLESNVMELHEKFFGQQNYDPTDTVKTISESISARTGFW